MLLFCPKCGKENPDQTLTCVNCGYNLSAKSESPQTTQIHQYQLHETIQPTYVRKSNRKLLIVGIVVLVVIGAVLLWNNMNSGISEAQKVADKFYFDLKANDLESASQLYHALWIQNTSAQNTTIFINSINSRLGNITDYKLVNSDVYIYQGSPSSYTKVTLVYSVTRTKYASQETLVLLKDSSNTQFQIASWNINSQGLLTP